MTDTQTIQRGDQKAFLDAYHALCQEYGWCLGSHAKVEQAADGVGLVVIPELVVTELSDWQGNDPTPQPPPQSVGEGESNAPDTGDGVTAGEASNA